MEKNEFKKGLSRRDFLKGAAAGAVGVATAGILGACSDTASQTSTAETTAAATAGTTQAATTAAETTSAAAQTSAAVEEVPVVSASGERVSGYCGPGDWLGEAPVISDSEIDHEETVDVVILGGGHSGLAAAMGVADSGATGVVIEQFPWESFVTTDGSNAGGWYGEDIGHVNSQFLIDRGFGPYNTGEIVAEFCLRAAGRVNPDIIRSFVQNSGPMFDRYKEIYDMYEDARKEDDSEVTVTNTINLEDEAVYDYSNMFDYPLCNTQKAYKDVTYPIEGGGYKTWPCNAQFYGYQGNNIEYIHKYIKRYSEENGVAWYFEHTGVVLVQDSNGTVTGLIAADADGKYVKFNANKGVILCAGDFIGDPAMCWALLNEGMEWGERSGATADDWASTGTRAGIGHKMGCWAGGMIEPSPRGWMGIGGGASGPWGVTPLLQLNAEGKRFYNEAAIAQIAAIGLRQPEGIACYVTDSKWEETVCAAPLDHGAPNFGLDEFYTDLKADMDAIVVGPEGGEVVGANLAERKMMKRTVYAADTLAELAGYLGYEGDLVDQFVESVEAYNELCNSEDGDTDYGKNQQYMIAVDTPPYYGGTSSLSHSSSPRMVSLAGLITDTNQNVLTTEWTPIPGLYAAGNCLGGRYGMGYSTPMAGNSVGMAMTHGWVAGKTVSEL